MHPPREGDVFHFLRREIESTRDHPGKVAALLAMSRSVVLPQFGGARQGFHGLLQRFVIRIILASAQLAERADQFFDERIARAGDDLQGCAILHQVTFLHNHNLFYL